MSTWMEIQSVHFFKKMFSSFQTKRMYGQKRKKEKERERRRERKKKREKKMLWHLWWLVQNSFEFKKIDDEKDASNVRSSSSSAIFPSLEISPLFLFFLSLSLSLSLEFRNLRIRRQRESLSWFSLSLSLSLLERTNERREIFLPLSRIPEFGVNYSLPEIQLTLVSWIRFTFSLSEYPLPLFSLLSLLFSLLFSLPLSPTNSRTQGSE